MESNEVWPPPPDKETTPQSAAPRKCSRAASILGVVSFALSVPALLLFVAYKVNWYFGDSQAFQAMMLVMHNGVMVVILLPFLGLVLGIFGWPSRWGKLGVACAVLYCAYTIYMVGTSPLTRPL
jgi:hypothetical protein